MYPVSSANKLLEKKGDKYAFTDLNEIPNYLKEYLGIVTNSPLEEVDITEINSFLNGYEDFCDVDKS